MQRTPALGFVVRPATGLAVDRHQTPLVVGVDQDRIRDPGPETALEGFRSQGDEEPPDAVAWGDAVGQCEVQCQPRLTVLGPAMDGGGAVATADDAADGDDGDIDQQMVAVTDVPRVG